LKAIGVGVGVGIGVEFLKVDPDPEQWVQLEVRVSEKNLSNIICHPFNELVICDWLLVISHFSLDQAEGNAF
jgi:hypothetical protein